MAALCGLDVVGGKETGLAGLFVGALHPALSDDLAVQNEVSLEKGELVIVSGIIAEEGPEAVLNLLGSGRGSSHRGGSGGSLGHGGSRGGNGVKGGGRIIASGIGGGIVVALVIANVGGERGVLLVERHLGGVSHSGELVLGLLILSMVLDLALKFGVFLQTEHLWGVRHSGGGELGIVGNAIRLLLKSLVVLHVQGHLAHLASEAGLVPDLVKAGELVDWVDDLLAGGARRVHGEIFPN